ncbi:MAG: oxaloacetate decarboxylase [Clostridia bacterium]|nr:oxaloacetate decarboxylase [Clostridia bacterium]
MEIKLSYDTLAESGAIMLKGMAGIFVVIGVIILVVFILNAIFRPKKEA